ncbi:MAG TPA: class I SAM-dependent methyltransferase [Anaerolineales bacterium]|nr:class I SAM-dependent methyltransferase [Anaerolineales bacterium]
MSRGRFVRRDCCSQCEGIEQMFDDEHVGEDLRLYRTEGPDETTGWLLDELEARGVDGLSLLDIGGGVGAIQHDLLAKGVKSAVHVDASSAYIEAAKREAKRRKVADKIEWHFGNFVDLAPDLKPADIVTLDKVICCYDDMPPLVRKSARLAKRFYGIVVPRDTWWLRIAFRVMDTFQNLFGNPYRAFVHPMEKIESIINRAGLKRVFERRNWMWQVVLYSR